jgi:hypothetical protein
VAGGAGQDMIGQRRRTGQRGVAAEERVGPGGGWRCRQGELGRVVAQDASRTVARGLCRLGIWGVLWSGKWW